ncbi:fibroblast growth factor 6 isoform X2 [Phaenicophaeus curvirostris]|uniref:fibroblast growth factor 6 isoform X2 n=1 Tax=Phaenicophaeus curvirostris TaxID=33595 RepID=UPI0037F0BBD8
MATAQRLLITMSCEASIHRTLPAFVLLGFLAGITSTHPVVSRTNGTLLERGWQSLLSRSISGMSGEKSDVNWESDYLLGIKRQRRLYCNVGIGFHLQILPDGRISGVHNENQYSLFEISTVERGVVSLFGVKSALFIAMNNKGKLYGTPSSASSSGKKHACFGSRRLLKSVWPKSKESINPDELNKLCPWIMRPLETER